MTDIHAEESPPSALGDRFTSPLHDARIATVLGMALGVAFSICFVTGVLSHLIQDPPAWFSWPSRPAGLYRFTQGTHVVTGIATIPLLLAKLWVVYPNLFERPAVRSVGHGVERLALLPLVGGSLLLLFTGVGNINIWRPWGFSFRTGHNAAAWIVMGGLLIHVVAKAATIRRELPLRRWRRADDPEAESPEDESSEAQSPEAQSLEEQADESPVGADGGLDRRSFVASVFASGGLLALFTAGQTVAPLRSLALLAPRRPDFGPQGFPVNRTAASVGLADVDLAAYRLRIEGPGVDRPLSLTYDELAAMPQREATLPIACVEGWSTTQRWSGVPLRDLLDAAGASEDVEARVVSLHRSRRQRVSAVNRSHARDRDTLLALRVNDEVLAPDHGFPVRLIGPNRPGVDQTKWVGRIVVS